MLQEAFSTKGGDHSSTDFMIATLLVASQRLPKPASASDPDGAVLPILPSSRDGSRDLAVLQELAAATCSFEALANGRQQELLECSRIMDLVRCLQWQLAKILNQHLMRLATCADAAEIKVSCCSLQELPLCLAWVLSCLMLHAAIALHLVVHNHSSILY